MAGLGNLGGGRLRVGFLRRSLLFRRRRLLLRRELIRTLCRGRVPLA
ncbi:hypothetical protein [Streptomyces sp. NPDC001508]